MISYNPENLLIFIHIPKTAGTSVRAVFNEWFGDKLHTHYFNNLFEGKPVKLSESIELSGQLVYGHFNKNRGIGIMDSYPSCNQFITILRDPFNATVSRYYHLIRNQNVAIDKSNIPDPSLSMQQWLMSTPPNMLDHLPPSINEKNYEEILSRYFIEIGITEHLEDSMRKIATKLNKPFHKDMLPKLNCGQYEIDSIESLRSEYKKKYSLPFEIYDYVAENYKD